MGADHRVGPELMDGVAWLRLTHADVPAGDGWLSAAERKVQGRLVVPKRRLDWRLGRYAAKQALAVWLAGPYGGVRQEGAPPGGDGHGLPPAQPLGLGDHPSDVLARLEVLAAADGAPEAWRAGGRLPVAVSLSHCDRVALVALAPLGVDVGCDIERIEPRGAGFARDYFTRDELAFLERRSPQESALWVTLIWSAKESALKALRQGLRLPTQAVEVRLSARPHAALSAVQGAWQGFEVVAAAGSRPGGLAGAWRIDGDRVATLVFRGRAW